MPGEFITSFLDKNYDSFCQRDISAPELCTLKKFSFSGCSPDYTKELHKEFYFLKYASAYITEYFLSYERIFSSDHLLEGDSVCALSLGCGAMLDLVGFEYARRYSKKFFDAIPIYYGVDIVDWDCSATKIIDNIKCYYNGIDTFSNRNKKPYDIICFPKSISDIGRDKILKFANKITCNDVWDKFCVIISKRGNSIDDADIGNEFVDVLRRNLSLSVKRELLPIEDNSEYFEDRLENEFTFNDDIGRYIQSISNKCDECCCEEELKIECKKIIGRWPMRKTKNICPEIYYLGN